MNISSNRISRSAPGILLTTALFLLFLPAINELVFDCSTDDNYSHGFLIPIISGFFLWQKREEISKAKKQVEPLGALVLLTGLGLTVFGTAAAEWFTLRVSLVVVILGIVTYLYGREVLRLTWFPIVFLLFAIPLPYTIFRSLTFPLQLFSTKVSGSILSAIGIPLLREGNILHVPGYSLEVVEACSGLRSMITLSVVAAAFSHILNGGPIKKILLLTLAVPVSVAANIFRLLVTTLGAMLISPSFADGFLHDFSGMIVFTMGLIFFAVINTVLGKQTK